MISELYLRWQTLFGQFSIDTERIRREFDSICQIYSQRGRAYHNLEHIAECLARYDEGIPSVSIEFAIWYHDAELLAGVTPPFNEIRSSHFLELSLPIFGVPKEIIENARRHILATSEHTVPTDERFYTQTADDLVMLDIDAWILGAEHERYIEYSTGIRAEHSSFPDKVYYPARLKIVKALLKDRVYYFTDSVTEEREEAARKNLETEREELNYWIKANG